MQNRLFMVVGVILVLAGISAAQSDLEEMYLRRAVKEFVAKNFDEAITNLEQVLTANRGNPKAKKLMAKCLVHKGNQYIVQNQPETAGRFFKKAAEFDPANMEAKAGMEQASAEARSAAAAVPSGPASGSGTASVSAQGQVQAQVGTMAPQQGMSPVVINAQLPSLTGDSNQIRIVSSLLDNFKRQQEIMTQQVQASNRMMQNTEDSKEKYLNALLNSSEQKNTMMKQFVIIGGAVVLGIIILIIVLFAFVFHRYAKATELRTLQAGESIAALLAAPPAAQTPLLLSAATGKGAQSGIAMEMLNTADPVQRAQAVEAVAAEIVEPEKNARLEKIKRLEELLKDENNRVRANAAKALYEIDKDASLVTLRDMLASESKRMRASAIWALGEIGTEEALGLILPLENEDDEIVKYNLKTALEKVKSQNRFPLGKEQQERIDARLKQLGEMA